MPDNFDAEAARKIIMSDERINVTENNPIKELFKICVNLALIIGSFYLIIFMLSGIILFNLPAKNQVQLENFFSKLIETKVVKISDADQKRLLTVRNNILNADKNFPKTSNLDIFIMDDTKTNAFCYPNGNIYITSALYKELTTDEELTFIIAHEMGHYKHKDHLRNMRDSITGSIVLIGTVFVDPSNQGLTKMTASTIDISNLKFSRVAEEKADKYAIKMLNILYGSSKAGVEVMTKLKEKNRSNIEFLSTHPNIDRRINYIKKLSY